MKYLILFFITIGLSLASFSQKKNCRSLHVGTFKAISKERGLTIIKRTKKMQVEENTYLGYKLAYDITWINDCTYELKLKQVIKGNPAIMNDSKYILKVQIKEIKKNSYLTDNSSTFSNEITHHEIMIVN